MKSSKRTISKALSLLLAGSMCVSGLPPALAAPGSGQGGGAGTGTLGLTLRFDLPQTAENAASRDIQLRVEGGGKTTVLSLPDGSSAQNGLNADIAVEVDNVEGVPLTTEERLGYYQVQLSGLPAGDYSVQLTGTGYKTFAADHVTLDSYSRHLVVGTGDGTFSLGDVNGDGQVNGSDLEAMSGRLGQSAGEYDLNGDGKLDVTDLSYIKYNLNGVGSPEELESAAILSSISMETEGLDVEGDPQDLLREDGEVRLTPQTAGENVRFTIDPNQTLETSQIRLLCPDGDGAIQAGQAVVELADGTTETKSFGGETPEGVHAIGRTVGQREVTIDLGKKVAIKKVTITVTAAAGGEGFVVVRKVEFLKEIIPDSPKNNQVQILSAVPGESSIALEWTTVQNVTGYKVAYWPAEDSTKVETMLAASTSTVVSGLENHKPYQFQVTAYSNTGAVDEKDWWYGTPSTPVTAAPEPGSVPGAPSNISVTPADQALRLSWGKTKDASYYQVFYREAGKSAFTQFGGDLTETSTTITGLTNGVTYEVAVKAGNKKGVGPFSSTAEGTPDREALEMPELPTDDRLDSSIVESVVMTNPNNVDRKLCPNFTPMDLVDNDAATYWIARVFWESHEFTYTFTEPQDMSYVIWVPYLNGNYKYMMAEYAVTAKDEAGNVLFSGSFGAPAMTEKNYLALPFPMVKGVKTLAISLSQKTGAPAVNIAEMAFYRSDGLADDIAALFSDGLFTRLADGVTAERIAELSARLESKSDFYLDLDLLRNELVLAQSLLEGKTDALGVLRSDFQSRSGAQDRQYGQSASALQPLGVSARARSTVAVYAQLPDDAPVYVTPTQFYGESGIWSGSPVQLVNGRNYISIPKIGSLSDERGGPLYLTYAGSKPEEIKLQLVVDSDSFHIPTLELSGWYDMDENTRRERIQTYVAQLESYVGALKSKNLSLDIRNATEISTPSVLLSIPADQALAGLKGVGQDLSGMAERMYQDVLAWEDTLYVANQVQGIIPAKGARTDSDRYPMTTRQNIRYMRMFAGAFMYAAGNHVGIGYGSTAGMMTGKPISQTGTGNPSQLFGWGIAHEIGHNMDKLGKAEITNNIYALALQAWDGGAMKQNTRLTNSNIWAKIYEKTSAGRPGSAGNVFVQLGMYWQLHLAYDNADKPLDFFNRFFTEWKSGAYSTYTKDERIALISSKVAEHDLTTFFTRWGLTLGEAAKNELKALNLPTEDRALWYLNDGSYAYRLENKAAFSGNVAVTASVNENQATLTITGGDETILGYEILRNGVRIAFTTEPTYVDDLGPANNLSYTYSVVPVDKLGNQKTSVSADEVRVAYDKPIASELYQVKTLDDGTREVTLTKTVPVTGVKITGTNLSGEYTVQVKANAADAGWTLAKTGTLSGNEVVDYFTKPGAAVDDPRIWTYDAAVMRITGVPKDAAVVLLDYPGDRIDFYQAATVGSLKSELSTASEALASLVYGTRGDTAPQTIPAGSLVVLGTYRGDPAYCTVELEVRYNKSDDGAEDGEKTFVERPMNGYSLLFAELAADKKVSDTSDGFWIFVPDVEAEKKLNQETGIPPYIEMDKETGEQGEKDYFHPMEIRAVFYRYDNVDHTGTPRQTSNTMWISFPAMDTLPEVSFQGEGVQ